MVLFKCKSFVFEEYHQKGRSISKFHFLLTFLGDFYSLLVYVVIVLIFNNEIYFTFLSKTKNETTKIDLMTKGWIITMEYICPCILDWILSKNLVFLIHKKLNIQRRPYIWIVNISYNSKKEYLHKRQGIIVKQIL